MQFSNLPEKLPKKRENDRSTHIELEMVAQPDETTCGPTCLHAVYRFYKDPIELSQVIQEVHSFEDGGTLAVWLGCHALSRGYEATLFTCNLQLFDPTWFQGKDVNLAQKLEEQLLYKSDPKLHRTTRAILDFLQLGGKVRFEDFTRELIRDQLNHDLPILTGVSSTGLYRSAREVALSSSSVEYDDLRGEPGGHFVILCGYDKESKNVLIADPYVQNPFSKTLKYEIPIDRVLSAILLGCLTYDNNFVIIKPK